MFFDVTCPAISLCKGKEKRPPPSPPALSKARQSPTRAASPKKTGAVEEPSGSQPQTQSMSSNGRPAAPTLELTLYSNHGFSGTTAHNQNKRNPLDDSDSYLVGKCSINILRILSGATPYFDEWCPLYEDNGDSSGHLRRHKTDDEESSGRVRLVIEYEPTDPAPAPGDLCVFANAYHTDEVYPIPFYSVRNDAVQSALTSTSTSIKSSTSSPTTTPASQCSSQLSSSPTLCRKTYRVEEVIGDHVVLSYDTSLEKWHCTFEVHRYLLLTVERHQALVEKYRERVLDLCDNISQSPAIDAVARTVEAIPDEGLVYVGADAAEGGVKILGRWWKTGVEGLVEDVVDGINLDGRHTRLLEDDKEEWDEKSTNTEEGAYLPTPEPVQCTTAASAPDDGKILPGMPCCPITNVPMIEPVVAADGHTYERQAIARWLRLSNRSPLTGEVLAHVNLVPNYLLLSSLANEVAVVTESGEDGSGGDHV